LKRLDLDLSNERVSSEWMFPSVSVTIVTFNSEKYLEACLRSVFSQTYNALEVVVVDNASTDGTGEILDRFAGRIRLILNDKNLGFAEGQNQAIAASASAWVLVLNPDVVLSCGFIGELVDAGGIDEQVGTICGRLLAIGRDLRPLLEPTIDTAGLYFTPAMRHFDRGWQQLGEGQFGQMEYVFGASAAAALYRREMVADISEAGDFFDPDFFAYREDADVAWRAQLMGWRCLYVPGAVGHHVRSVGPGNRRAVPSVINMHSVKNRFLMRVKNMTSGLYRRFWLQATLRDLLVVGGCILWEPASLPAFWHIARCLPRAIRRRRWIMQRRRVADEILVHWFSTEPAGLPVAEKAKLIQKPA
jgi:GT2 family glycosyltransferase